MDLFEYQGKQLFASFGIPVSPGEPVDTVEDAAIAAEDLDYPVVVKAQGVAEIFTPGSTMASITEWLRAALDAREAVA